MAPDYSPRQSFHKCENCPSIFLLMLDHSPRHISVHNWKLVSYQSKFHRIVSHAVINVRKLYGARSQPASVSINAFGLFPNRRNILENNDIVTPLIGRNRKSSQNDFSATSRRISSTRITNDFFSPIRSLSHAVMRSCGHKCLRSHSARILCTGEQSQ